ncbi:ABC transporter permease [bacterium 1xD8-6]|nr:ABC transporter permease [bacterium D16-36]RKI71942.1 ABC transporter permease [bacterium 1xD8-6]
MYNAIITIFKKEIARFFGDKRTAFSTILLPGIMIFVMYSFMGDALSNQFSVDEDEKTVCYVQNLPADDTLQGMLQSGFTVKELSSEKDLEKTKEDIINKEADLCVVFPENFEKDVHIDRSLVSADNTPEVQIFYNSSETASSAAFQTMTALLDEFESLLANSFDVNRQKDGVTFDLASDEDSAASVFASMLPMLLLMFLFSGTVAVAPESIAGEKERGTIATLLVTPAKRGQIALGKILALSFIALLSGASSTIGTIISMPKLMGSASDNLSGSVYSVTDYLLLALVILSTVLLLVTAVSLISAFSKSIKEAQTYCSPLIIVAALVGITAMFGDGASTNTVHYIIPLYNSVQSMVQIFSFEAVQTPILLTVLSNILYSLIGAFGLTKMFQSEHIIFSK